jgi:hypothetical protein
MLILTICNAHFIFNNINSHLGKAGKYRHLTLITHVFYHAKLTVSIEQEVGWAPEQVWTQRLEEKSFAPAGDRTPIAWSSSP